MQKMIFASDLDNTLIYSHKRIKGSCMCVEWKEEKELSYMTVNSYESLQEIEKKVLFIPLTTRSLEQYNRIQLLKGKHPPYALVSNGGILLQDGKVDKEWLEESKKMVEPCQEQLEKAFSFLEREKNRIFDIRNIDGLFLFTKSENTLEVVADLKKQLDLSKMDVVENYNKVYVLPKQLNKGLAIKRLRKKFSKQTIIAAGDSSFDIPMLQEADISIALETSCFLETLSHEREIYYWNGQKTEYSDFVLQTVKKKLNGK